MSGRDVTGSISGFQPDCAGSNPVGRYSNASQSPEGEVTARRRLLPIEVAEQRYPHGTKARYTLGKCRCFQCRVANTTYTTERYGLRRKPYRTRCVGGGKYWLVLETETGREVYRTTAKAIARRRRDALNRREDSMMDASKLVSTREAVAHIRWLQQNGIGLRTIEKQSGVARSVIKRILDGRIARTRVETADRIAAVGLSSAPSTVFTDGAKTWALIDALMAHGYRKGWIAVQLGASRPALQIRRDRVRISTAGRVRALYLELCKTDARLPRFDALLGVAA